MNVVGSDEKSDEVMTNEGQVEFMSCVVKILPKGFLTRGTKVHCCPIFKAKTVNCPLKYHLSPMEHYKYYAFITCKEYK